MARNILDLAFAVRQGDDSQSSVWRLWATRQGDVYFASRGLAGIAKYSFHISGICRSALTSQQVESGSRSRLIHRWVRLPSPPSGSSQASRVMLLAVPSDYLSLSRGSAPAHTTWVAAASQGGATFFELAFTRESRASVESAFLANGRTLLAYGQLPTDESVLLNYYHGDWVNQDLRLEGNADAPGLLFSASDPRQTGRPIRLTFGPMPNDCDSAILQELGGYVEEAG